ncbi:MAG: alpha-amylase family glycosyl hydrolase [Candidatus Woesearchaeota archaeon]
MKKVVTLTDVGLIAYPDSIQYETANNKPLKKLISFINKTQFDLIHILPFRPSDADKGFAVTDYTSVDSRFGSITDIKRCKKKIMIDFILNHTSIHHPWFTNFLKGKIREDPFAAQ